MWNILRYKNAHSVLNILILVLRFRRVVEGQLFSATFPSISLETILQERSHCGLRSLLVDSVFFAATCTQSINNLIGGFGKAEIRIGQNYANIVCVMYI